MTTVWDELVAAALIGTDRRPYTGVDSPAEPDTSAGLDAPAEPDAAAGPAGSPPGGLRGAIRAAPDLLAAATMVWAYGEAGRRAVPGPVNSTDEPVDDRRALLPCGAVGALSAILDDRRFRPVLNEWLDLADRSGQRLPAEWVPALLRSVREPQRPGARRVVGPLGAWLAARNPDWRWAASPVAPKTRRPDGSAGAGRDGEVGAGVDADAVAALEAAAAEALPALVGIRSGPWSTEVTDAALAALSRCVADQGPRLLAVRKALPGLALLIDPGRADEASALIEIIDALPPKTRLAARAYWTTPLGTFAAVVHFRRSLHEEFS